MRGTKTLKIEKNCTKNMKNCKKLHKMQKIAIFLKIAKKCSCDFPEGQMHTSQYFLKDFSLAISYQYHSEPAKPFHTSQFMNIYIVAQSMLY